MIHTEEIAEESLKKLDPVFISSVDKNPDTSSTYPQSQSVTDESDFPPDEDIFDMLKDVNLEKPLPNVTERYFTAYYRINFPKEGDDICIRIHTNRLCMISLAPSHEIFQKDRKIEKIDFQVTEKLNRAENAVSGKAKHGAQPLHESSKICSITCTSGETWIVRCGMNGKLTEANTDLLENPELLRKPPHKGGYLAIVLPKINDLEKLKNNLLTQEAYDAAMRDRLNSERRDGSNRINGAIKRPCENDDNDPAILREKIMKTEVVEDAPKIVEKKADLSILACT